VGVGAPQPLIGERIIGAAPALVAVAKLVGATHERLDGTGYPNGLQGDQSPLGARIIAVCDAFTAMAFPRTYAAQLPVTQAIAELWTCADSHFDPAVVDTLANLVLGLAWPPEQSTASSNILDRVPDRG
jgi:two-component system, cell cycle response regulator